MIDRSAIIYGFSQAVAIVDVAIGTGILLAVIIVKLSHWYRSRDVLNRIEEAELEQ